LLKVKKRIEKDGRIEIGDLLKDAKIKPGDWVEVSPYKDKIVIKISMEPQPKGVVKTAAGILKEDPVLIEEMLKTREEKDDRPGADY